MTDYPNSTVAEDDLPEARLARLGLSLPKVPAPIGNFDLGSIDGTTLYLTGADGTELVFEARYAR